MLRRTLKLRLIVKDDRTGLGARKEVENKCKLKPGLEVFCCLQFLLLEDSF